MVAAAAGLVALPAAGAAAVEVEADRGRFVDWSAVATAAIVPPHVTIWLPPGYARGRQRYGVVYMNDGQNVFFPDRSGYAKVWAADRAVLALVAARRIDPVIIVAVDHPGDARYRQYFPQRLYDMATPARRAQIDRLAKGPLTGDAYLRFLTQDLKPRVDRTFRTRPDPAHTAIIGSSMGGLIACYAFVERPDVFGRAACVSTHWPLADPTDVGPFAPDVAALCSTYLTQHLGRPAGRRLWMDHGTATLDAEYPPWQRAIDADLVRLGWRRERDFTSHSYAGAAHEENAWAARLPAMLAWLLA